MKDEQMPQPCDEWAETLAMTRLGHLTTENREAFDAHVSSCLACRAVLEEYRLMDNYWLRSAETSSSPFVSPQLQAAWKRAFPKPESSHTAAVRVSRSLPSRRPMYWLLPAFFFLSSLSVCIYGLRASPISWAYIVGGVLLCIIALGIALAPLRSHWLRAWEKRKQASRERIVA